jgi:hypothetical protein
MLYTKPLIFIFVVLLFFCTCKTFSKICVQINYLTLGISFPTKCYYHALNLHIPHTLKNMTNGKNMSPYALWLFNVIFTLSLLVISSSINKSISTGYICVKLCHMITYEYSCRKENRFVFFLFIQLNGIFSIFKREVIQLSKLFSIHMGSPELYGRNTCIQVLLTIIKPVLLSTEPEKICRLTPCDCSMLFLHCLSWLYRAQ